MNQRMWRGSAPIITLMSKLASVSTCPLASSFIHQLLRQVGFALEAALEDAAASLKVGKPVDFLKLAEFGGTSSYQRHQALGRHVAASRCAAMQFPTTYSYGTDASRVGYKARSNFAFVLPNNGCSFSPCVVTFRAPYSSRKNLLIRTFFLLIKRSVFSY